ncbi:type I restriction enzyme endonuclease domain-containing protein [Nostoc sp.]|uniref:type I restriction enzyme endonuclease domain-containing protein n=1 Tax=Nostoc sp. TaxID=1180 RepID=UPI002FF928F3
MFTPVQAKTALVTQLREAIAQTTTFCIKKGIDFAVLESAQGFARTKFWADAVESIIINNDAKKTYLSLAANANKLYKAILLDPAANEFTAINAHLQAIKDQILAEVPEVDVSEVIEQVEELLDLSITAGEFVIQESHSQRIDLSQIDFVALKNKFTSTDYQRTETEKLKTAIAQKLQQMVRLNKTRINYLDKFQQMIAEHNADSRNVQIFFNDLINFAQQLGVEDKRAITKNLTQEELAIFDLLTKPEIKLTRKEEQELKQVARELLETLKKEKLVLDWKKRQQTRASIEVAIKDSLDRLPQSYSAELYEQKCQEFYQHIYENYSGQRSIYDAGA